MLETLINGNDLCDLDSDLGVIDRVHTYLAFKIPLPVSFAYDPKEHSYTFIALSYQNCRSSQKYEKMAKNDQFIPRTS